MDFSKLPDHIRYDLRMIEFRLSENEKQTRANTDELERRHGVLSEIMRQEVRTPFGSLPLPLAVCGSAFAVWLKPDLLTRFLG